MGMLDGLLGQITNNVDIANLAAKGGLDPAQVEQAVSALSQAHPQPGDTAEQAAATTGLSADSLRQIVDQIGGEGALGRFADLLGAQGDAGWVGGLVYVFFKRWRINNTHGRSRRGSARAGSVSSGPTSNPVN